MSKLTARAVIRICDYMIGYHGAIINRAIASIAGAVITMAAFLALAILTM